MSNRHEPEESDPTDNTANRSVTRRRILQATGAMAVAGAAVTGTAKAHGVFYGCSQVCVHTDTNRSALILKDDGSCETRSNWVESNRNDPRSRELRDEGKTGKVYCISVDGNSEKIVGLCVNSGFRPNDPEYDEQDGYVSNGQCATQPYDEPPCANEC